MDDVYNKPLVSIIISAYNHEKYIVECLDSVFSQNYENFEVIIRDDGSSDNTANIINEYVKNNFHINKKINTIIEFGDNIGLIQSLNWLLRNSIGEIIMLCASDDVYLSDRISIAVNYHIKYRSLDLIACNAIVINDNGDKIKESFYSWNKNDLSDVQLFENLNYKDAIGIALGGFGLSFKRSLLMEIDFQFPNNLLFEDGYLSFLATCNNGALIIRKPLMKYRRSNNGISKIDTNLSRNNILIQETRISKLLLSLAKSKYDYLINNKNFVNKDIQKNRLKAIKYAKQNVLINSINHSFLNNEKFISKWLSLLWLFIIGRKRIIVLKTLIFSLSSILLNKQLINQYLRRSKVLN